MTNCTYVLYIANINRKTVDSSGMIWNSSTVSYSILLFKDKHLLTLTSLSIPPDKIWSAVSLKQTAVTFNMNYNIINCNIINKFWYL